MIYMQFLPRCWAHTGARPVCAVSLVLCYFLFCSSNLVEVVFLQISSAIQTPKANVELRDVTVPQDRSKRCSRSVSVLALYYPDVPTSFLPFCFWCSLLHHGQRRRRQCLWPLRFPLLTFIYTGEDLPDFLPGIHTQITGYLPPGSAWIQSGSLHLP